MDPVVTLIARGGGNEIGASCYDYFFDNELVRIDIGFRPRNFNSDIRCLKVIGDKRLENFLDQLLIEPEIDPLPNWDTVTELKHLFLSHGHIDHIGAVPYVLRKHRHAIVYVTAATLEFCKIQWSSTPKIAERKGEVPLFNESDVEFALSRIQVISPGVRVRINENLEIEPALAGHLLGAISLIFYWKGAPIGIHTGDFTVKNKQRLVADAAELQFDGLRFLTTESTRITGHNSPRYLEEGRFNNILKESFYDKGMSIFIPTFAVGRLTEIFVLCKEACPNADIWIDGQGRETSTIYAHHTGSDKILSGIEGHFVRDKAHRLEILDSDKPNIVLSPAAMQFGGFSRRYIEKACLRSDHLVISPGYRDPRSPEFAFFEAPRRSVFRFGERDMPKFCKTETFNFTSHCDGDDVLDLKGRTKPQVTCLIHGDKQKMKQFIDNNPDQGFVIAENDQPISF